MSLLPFFQPAYHRVPQQWKTDPWARPCFPLKHGRDCYKMLDAMKGIIIYFRDATWHQTLEPLIPPTRTSEAKTGNHAHTLEYVFIPPPPATPIPAPTVGPLPSTIPPPTATTPPPLLALSPTPASVPSPAPTPTTTPALSMSRLVPILDRAVRELGLARETCACLAAHEARPAPGDT